MASFISRAENGEEIVVTSGGKPVARISPVADGATRLAELVEEDIVRPPTSSERYIPSKRIKSAELLGIFGALLVFMIQKTTGLVSDDIYGSLILASLVWAVILLALGAGR